MVTLNKHQYHIISGEYNSDGSIPKSIVFKIVDSSDAAQIPHFRLFTQDPELLNHLTEYGFVSNRCLTTQVLSFVGKIKADQLLQKYDLQTNNGSPGIPAINKTVALIDQLQQEIKALQNEELEITPFDISKQYQLKLKLSLLVQQTVYTIKKINSTKYDPLLQHLDQAINLIDSYQFTDHFFSKQDQIYTKDNTSSLLTSDMPYYNVSPNKINSINKFDDIVKFYLAINQYQLTNSIKIEQEEIDKINKLRQEHKSKFTFNSFFGYISTHPWQVAIFLFIAMLEFICIPTLTPILSSISILKYFGLGNPFILMSFCMTTTFSLINFCSTLPKFLYRLYSSLHDYFNPLDFSGPINPSHAEYIKINNKSVLIFPDNENTTQTSSSNSPIVSSILNFITNEYKNYSNWFFSYIQRNPISFLIYIILRSMSLFLSLFIPVGNLLYCTYIDLDKEIDRESNNPHHFNFVEQTTIHGDPNSLTTDKTDINISAIIFDACKLISLKLPLSIIHILSKTISSTLYVIFYLLINLVIQPFQTFRFDTVYYLLLEIEQMATNLYYNIYYEQDYIMQHAYNAINNFQLFQSSDTSPELATDDSRYSNLSSSVLNTEPTISISTTAYHNNQAQVPKAPEATYTYAAPR